MKQKSALTFLTIFLVLLGAMCLDGQGPLKKLTHKITGKVEGMKGGDHATVTAGVRSGISATTQDDGTYVLAGLGPGSHAITVSSHPHYTFSPNVNLVAITDHDVDNVNFQAQNNTLDHVNRPD